MRRPHPAALRALGCALLAIATAAPAIAEDVDLLGTWYVLIHYKDDHASNVDQERWDDKVWKFTMKGRRLAWIEYPIVVFDDETGRFERRSTGQYARILHYWEPNAAQRIDIRNGLQVNSRGSKQKSLRGSAEDGWSSSRRKSAASASVVTYQEVWTIEGTPALPVFSRADFMGSGRSDTLEGLTQYATTKVTGNVLSGTFERDGTRHGTFRMTRSDEVGALKSQKTQSERQRQAAIQSLSQNPELRADVEKQVREGLAEYGLYLGDSDLGALVTRGFELASQGVPVKQIERRLGGNLLDDFWSLAPRGARHDDTARYRFPFDTSSPRKLYLGVGSEDALSGGSGPAAEFEDAARHAGWSRFAFKFSLPVGTPVVAARGGEVVRVIDGFNARQVEVEGNLSSVWVRHEDGTIGAYLHLGRDIPVRPGARVEAGDPLGKSGTPGYVKVPLLHFSVLRVDGEGSPQSIDIRFDDGTPEGVVPIAGKSYPEG